MRKLTVFKIYYTSIILIWALFSYAVFTVILSDYDQIFVERIFRVCVIASFTWAIYFGVKRYRCIKRYEDTLKAQRTATMIDEEFHDWGLVHEELDHLLTQKEINGHLKYDEKVRLYVLLDILRKDIDS